MMTTKTAGIGVDEANPKPVRHINWCGQPMEEGDNYWGGSDTGPQESKAEQVQTVVRARRKVKRGGAWTPERRAEYSAKVKAWWQAKKEKSTTGET